jgi:hypothetical protein
MPEHLRPSAPPMPPPQTELAGRAEELDGRLLEVEAKLLLLKPRVSKKGLRKAVRRAMRWRDQEVTQLQQRVANLEELLATHSPTSHKTKTYRDYDGSYITERIE